MSIYSPENTTPKLLTVSEYEAYGNRYEIIDGRLVQRALMSTRAIVTRDNIYDILKPVVVQNKLGYLFNDGMIFYMWKTEKGIKNVFVPDVAFIRKQHVVKGWTIKKRYRGVPDLAVEVVSPDNSADEVVLKARRYLERGTEEVWVIYPEAEEIHQYHKNQPDTVRVYRGSEKLDASAFFPGVTIAVADLVKLPDLD